MREIVPQKPNFAAVSLLWMVVAITLLGHLATIPLQRNLALVRRLSVPADRYWALLLGPERGTPDEEFVSIVQAEPHFSTGSWLLALQSGCGAIPERLLASDTLEVERPIDLFHAGVCLSMLNRPIEAARTWQKIHRPDLAERILFTSQRLAETCCPDVAQRLVAGAVELGVQSAESYFQLGHYHRYRGEIDLAIMAYTQAAQQARDEPRYGYALGMYLYQFGQPKDATYWLERVVELQPHNSEAILLLAHAYRDSGMLNQAANWYRVLMALDPANPGPLFGLASVERKRGDWSKAVGYAQAALALVPDNAGAQLELASYLIGAGKLDEAKDLCRRALAKQPRLPTGYLLLGLIAEARGKWVEAQNFYRHVLQLDPQREAAQQGLIRVQEIIEDHNRP